MLKRLLLLLLLIFSINLIGCSNNTMNNNAAYLNADYKSDSVDALDKPQGKFISDWQDGEMNIEGNKPSNTANSKYLSVTEQGSWIYYVDNYSICKEDAYGQQYIIAEFSNRPKQLSVVGDWIYYLYETNLYKIRTDGECQTLLIEDVGSPWSSYYIYNDRIYYFINEQTSADTFKSTLHSCTLDTLDDIGIFYLSDLSMEEDVIGWNILGMFENKLLAIPEVENLDESKYLPQGIFYFDLDTYEVGWLTDRRDPFLDFESQHFDFFLANNCIIAFGMKSGNCPWIRIYDLHTYDIIPVNPVINGNEIYFLRSLNYDEINDRYIMACTFYVDKESFFVDKETSIFITDGIEGLKNNNWTEISSDNARILMTTSNYIYYDVDDVLYRIDYDGQNWKRIN